MDRYMVHMVGKPSKKRSLFHHELRNDLAACLGDIQSAGDFALFSPIVPVVSPGLHLKGAKDGNIRLPLSERDAQAIIAAAHEAPYGKGEQTLVDPSFRKTWELAPDRFELRNPKWQTMVDGLLEDIQEGMGIQEGSGIKAELYKMLLYDKGAMFKPHQDSEKAPRMFGTLVICLPSLHEGGEVELAHMGKTKTFETAKYSQSGMSFMSWFSDVFHEIKPVKSGYRLVLTYNLIYTGSPPRSTNVEIDASTALCRLLSDWTTKYNHGEGDGPDLLVYKLEHQYTNANLDFNALKGRDREAASQLRVACEKTGCFFYLASLEKTVFGSCEDDYDFYGGYGRFGHSYYDEEDEEDDEDNDSDEDDESGRPPGGITPKAVHPIDEEIEVTMQLSHLVDLNGNRVSKDIPIDEEEIIQENIFDREPDDEDYSGYTGNEGVSATHYYRDTVAVIIPKGGRVPALLGKLAMFYGYEEHVNSILESWFKVLSDALTNDLAKKEAELDLIQMCKLIVSDRRRLLLESPSYGRSLQHSGSVIGQALEFTVKFKHQHLFLDILASQSGALPSSIYDAISDGIALFGFTPSLESHLNAIVKIYTEFESRFRLLNDLRKSFKMLKLRDLNIVDTKAEDAAPVASQAQSTEGEIENSAFYKWTNKQLAEAITQCSICSEGDGLMLVEISVLFGPKFLYDSILPLVKKHASQTDMIIAFTNSLIEAGDSNRIARNVSLGVFRDVLQDMVDSFRLQPSAPSNNKMRRLDWNGSWAREDFNLKHTQASPSNESQNMANLVMKCLGLGFNPEVDQIFTQIINEASTIEVHYFSTHVLPFLKVLTGLLTAKGTDLTQPRLRLLFQQTLRIYIDRYVGPEPKPPIGWTRPAKGPCRDRCSDCRELDQFIRDPERRTIEFARVEKTRQHLTLRFDLYKIDRAKSSSCGDFTLETIRQGRPHTLVIKKKEGLPNSFKQTHKEWHDRCTTAKQAIDDLGIVPLKQLLAEQFNDIFALAWVFARNSPANASAGAVTVLAPIKPSAANISPFHRDAGSASAKAGSAEGTEIPVIDLTSLPE